MNLTFLISSKRTLRQSLLLLGIMLSARGSTGHAFDSVTAACKQRPEQCIRVVGEEGLVPTVRGGAELASVATTLRVLTADTKAAVERVLVECVEWASAEINRQRMGRKSPSRERCQEVLSGVDPCGRKVTRGMHLGHEKHALAFQCARERLGSLIPGRFSLEQRYRYDRRTTQKQPLTPEEVRVLLRNGCGDDLVPDVVIHSGNPLEVQAVYDFKFPCPISNEPQWYRYPEGHPYWPSHQGLLYEESYAVKPLRVAPIWGIQ